MMRKELVEKCNLFCWFPFKENASILVVEGVNGERISLRGHHVTYISSEKELGRDTFDYVIIHDNTLDYVRRLQPYLKEDGKMLLTTANPLSVSYGLQVRKYFRGIATRSEIEQAANEAGLVMEEIFYPYPNHWHPVEVFSDATIHTMTYGRCADNYLPNYTEPEHLKENCEMLQREHLMSQCANSFFVVLSKDGKPEKEEILYVKISGDRKEAYQIYTEIDLVGKEKVVRKKPICPDGINHISCIRENDAMSIGENIYMLPGTQREDGIEYPYLRHRTLDDLITQYLETKDAEGIIHVLDQFWEKVVSQCQKANYQTTEFVSVFGHEGDERKQLCLCPANIDLIAENIFIDREKYIVIDNEWVFHFPVPVQFLIWRCVNELYQKHESLKELLGEDTLKLHYQITSNLDSVFDAWNHAFTCTYVGAGGGAKYMEPVQLPLITTEEYETMGFLYFDCGDGFSEDAVSCLPTVVGPEGFSASIKIQRDASLEKIRFTPQKGHLCKCNVDFYVNGTRLSPIFSNGITTQRDEMTYFITPDPQLYYDVSNVETEEMEISITGQILFLQRDEIGTCMEETQGHMRQLQGELDEIKNSRSWQTIQKCKRILKR